MLDAFDALTALAEHGTMSRAGTALRITASSVSKRIATLEAELGTELLERDGRRVRLTAAGRRLVAEGTPHAAALRALAADTLAEASGLLRIAVSESILASWGPALLRAATDSLPGVRLRMATHRAPVCVDLVRSAEARVALVPAPSDLAPDLHTLQVATEEMTIVPAGLSRRGLGRAKRIDVLTIEPASGTWRAVRRQLGALRRAGGPELRVAATLQSFPGIVRMAAAGFGHALAPRGVARALGVPSRSLFRLPAPGLHRPISLVARRTAFGTSLLEEFTTRVTTSVRGITDLRAV